MAYTRFYFGGPAVNAGLPLAYYLCDTAGDLPSSGLFAGELASTLDVPKIYVAVDATTWRELTKASSTGYAGTGMLGSGTANNTTYLRGDNAWATPPGGGGPHAADHQNGGTDEISVAGLSGLLADAQTPTAHSHPISDVTSLQTSLDGKSATGHTHVKANITDFAHTHVKADVTDFAHTHPQSDVTNLVTDLAGKAAASHTHAAGDLPSLSGITAPAGSVNFNGQQATSFRIENRTSDPVSPTVGQIWLRTDLA